MKASILAACILVALTARVALAGGVGLAWNDCVGGGGLSNRNFACDTNNGTHDLYLSFEPSRAIIDLNGSNPSVDIQTAKSSLPAWWQFKNASTCRQASLSAMAAITGSCPEPWSGQGTPGIAAYYTQANAPNVVGGAANRARILGTISVPSAAAASVSPGTEYFCLLLRINNARTVGGQSCGDCATPMCLVANEILLTSMNSGDDLLINPLGSNVVSWQGGGVGGTPCAGSQTVNRTWGQLKSVYR